MIVLEFFNTVDSKYKPSEVFSYEFVRSYAEATRKVRENFPDTKVVWDNTVDGNVFVVGDVGVRTRDIPSVDHYEFLNSVRQVLPEVLPFIEDRLNRFKSVAEIRSELAMMVQTRLDIDNDEFGL